jgi:hypothetical protein
MKYAAEMARVPDIHTKFHKDWYRHSKVDTDNSQTHGMVIS